MMQALYLDTNVLLDFLFFREPFFDAAREVIALGKIGNVKLYVSALSVVTAFYIAEKYKKDINELKMSLNELSSFISIVDLSSDNIMENIKNDWSDFEDSTQYYSAQSVEADYIITRNAKDFLESNITVCSPQEYLSLTR